MPTSIEHEHSIGLLLNKTSANFRIKFFGCASYIFMHKEALKDKLDDGVERGVNPWSRQKIYMI